MKTEEIKRANDLLEKYETVKKDIEKTSNISSITLCYYGHSSHALRGQDTNVIKVALIRNLEERACSILTQLVSVGVDIDHERGFLDSLVAQSLKLKGKEFD